ncbi:MAG: hypothetical protein J0I79_05570 [Mesorhizobium sp.]|uniref:hypothetical protein n=1 Tax=Mesorhizobium sp. TaxID=1871066 RepID=UPI001ACD1AF0|nr:hypothetical protein [Mesorhizobium sp.]MBN9217403.1 hypothetical protein [Mesorhizobium sp.]
MDSYNEVSGLAPGRPGAQHEPRKRDPATMAAVSPLPPPEEVFADWLLSVPHDADLAHAARCQIDLIDRRLSLHPDVQVLRTLLAAVAGTSVRAAPVTNL